MALFQQDMALFQQCSMYGVTLFARNVAPVQLFVHRCAPVRPVRTGAHRSHGYPCVPVRADAHRSHGYHAGGPVRTGRTGVQARAHRCAPVARPTWAACDGSISVSLVFRFSKYLGFQEYVNTSDKSSKTKQLESLNFEGKLNNLNN